MKFYLKKLFNWFTCNLCDPSMIISPSSHIPTRVCTTTCAPQRTYSCSFNSARSVPFQFSAQPYVFSFVHFHRTVTTGKCCRIYVHRLHNWASRDVLEYSFIWTIIAFYSKVYSLPMRLTLMVALASGRSTIRRVLAISLNRAFILCKQVRRRIAKLILMFCGYILVLFWKCCDGDYGRYSVSIH